MISIVIPAYNEQGSIASTITEIKSVLDAVEKDYEIVVVDDGSKDGTAAEAEGAGARVVKNPHNAGYGLSLKRGITAAKYDTVMITDADLTYPAKHIPDLIKTYRDGKFDMVVGQRTGEHYRESALKAPMRAILKFLVEFTAGRHIPDINSGMRIFDRNTVKEHFSRLCDTFSFTTSMTLAYMMTGRFVTYMPIEYNERVGRSKVRLFRDSIRTLQYIIEAAVYYNPLKIFILMMLLLMIASFLLFVTAAFSELHIFYILGIGSLLSGIFVFCFGLIAVLLKQIMQK